MAKESLREHLNRKLKEKGTTLKAEKAKAKKYNSIAEAKKGKSLYYTDKNGKTMAAVYATDLKDKGGLKTSLRPVLRPKPKAPKPSEKPDTNAEERAKNAEARKAAAAVLARENIEAGKKAVIKPSTGNNASSPSNTKGRPKNPAALKRYLAAQEKLKKNKGGPVTKKTTGYKVGGMAMVTDPKTGKKVPDFAADGKGKMNKGGMTKSKSSGYMHGGTAKKKPADKMMAGGMAKKKPAAKKMMGGGSTGYMYGGMTKKKK